MSFPALSEWQALRARRYRSIRRLRVGGVVQHYTQAGNGRALARWIAQKAPVSAHIIICRDGHIIQQVDFEHEGVHAGEYKSKGFWKGAPQEGNANHFTIGIENSNYGWLIKDDEGDFWVPKKTTGGWTQGKRYRGLDPVQALDHKGQMKYWEPYSAELVASNIEVLKRIRKLYPHLTRYDVQGHSDISPHRKFDPGPLFPNSYILDDVFGLPPEPSTELDIGDIVLGAPGDPDEEDGDEASFELREYYDEDLDMCIDPTLSEDYNA